MRSEGMDSESSIRGGLTRTVTLSTRRLLDLNLPKGTPQNVMEVFIWLTMSVAVSFPAEQLSRSRHMQHLLQSPCLE